MSIEEARSSGKTWTMEDLHNGRLIGAAYYSNDRGNMGGGSVDTAYCWRVQKNQCIDMGLGFLGTKSSGPHVGGHENTLVPNLHVGTSFWFDETLSLGLLGRVGWATMRGDTGFSNYEEYIERGLYLEGAFRILGTTGNHKIFGSAVFLDGGVASFPEAGSAARGAGFFVRSGVIATFGRPKASK